MLKRGQVTIFIVLGIVILIAFGFLAAIKLNLFKTEFERELVRSQVPEQLKPVKTYIDNCLSSISETAVYTLSSRGGYLSIPKDIIPRSINNPFSNSLEIYPGNEVAYWFYESANAIQKQQIPTTEGIELELEEYLNEHFSDCYYELGTYYNQGFEIELSEDVDSKVNLENNHIEITIDAPMYVALNDVTKTIEKHTIKLEIPLKKFYDLSKKILENELESNFLEEKTIDMMEVYEEIPFSGTEFDCERKIWNKQQVKEDFKKIVNRNIGALNLKNSNYINLNDPYNYFLVDVTTSQKLTSNFMYSQTWPFAIEISPSKGDILLGDSITQSSPEISKFLNMFFCLNNYHFVYDVKYPVLISLMDESGYVFQFATLAIIDNNQPRRAENPYLDYTNDGEMKENICEYASKPITIDVFDYETVEPIKQADILYQCSVTTCYLGKTDDSGIFNGLSPSCLNGQIMAQKTGYHLEEQEFSTNEVDSSMLFLSKYTELDLDIKILDLNSNEIEEVEDREIIFQFENLDNEFITIVTNEDEKITLIPGYYKVTSYVMGEPNFDVTAGGSSFTQCIEVPKQGILGLFAKEEKCFETEIGEFDLEKIIIGGAEFEWEIYSLQHYNELTLYGAVNDLPNSIMELNSIFEDMKTNNKHNNFREPELS